MPGLPRAAAISTAGPHSYLPTDVLAWKMSLSRCAGDAEGATSGRAEYYQGIFGGFPPRHRNGACFRFFQGYRGVSAAGENELPLVFMGRDAMRGLAPESRSSGPAAVRVPVPFDYDKLPTSVRAVVREQSQSIRSLLAKTSANFIQIGLRLQFIRARLGRVHFQQWLKAEFEWSQPAASNYMRAAAAFGELDCVDQFQPSALFVLARRKVPASARADAIDIARQGHLVTKALAEEIVQRHVPTSESGPSIVDQIRRAVLKALPKLSFRDRHDIEELADELRTLARRLDGTCQDTERGHLARADP